MDSPDRKAQTISYYLRWCIRERMALAGVTQATMGEQLGVTQSSVSYVVSGNRRREPLDLFERIAGLFGMTLSDLLKEAEVRRAVTTGATVRSSGKSVVHSQTHFAPAAHRGSAHARGKPSSSSRVIPKRTVARRNRRDPRLQSVTDQIVQEVRQGQLAVTDIGRKVERLALASPADANLYLTAIEHAFDRLFTEFDQRVAIDPNDGDTEARRG